MSMLATWSGPDCALQVTSRTAAAMMPGRSGVPPWHLQVDLPHDAVRPRLQGANLDPTVLRPAVQQIAGAAPRKVGRVTLVLPDACAKLRIVPIEADEVPGKKVSGEIIRWALRDALPFPADEALVDTRLFDGDGPARLLLAAAHRDVLRQYEDAAEPLGPVVRTLPATLACGWGVDDEAGQHLLVYADDDTLGCLLSRSGTPLFIRTRPLPPREAHLVEAVMETLDYVGERLGAEPGRATVMGLAAEDQGLRAALTDRGWSLSPAAQGEAESGARTGALAGALRAAEAGT